MRFLVVLACMALAGCAGGVQGVGVPDPRLKVVQDQLVVRSIDAADADTAVVRLTYQGTVPLVGLHLALQTAKVRVLADAGAVAGGQTFDVVFEKAGSGIGAGGRVTIAVDGVK